MKRKSTSTTAYLHINHLMSYWKEVDDIWIQFNIVYEKLLELDDNTPATSINDYLDLDERLLKLIAINPSPNGGFQNNGSFFNYIVRRENPPLLSA